MLINKKNYFLVDILTVNVRGEGVVAELCQDLVGVLQPLVKIVNVDATPCLPIPNPPNFEKYKLISALIIASWIILILEPFSLRCRSMIMSHYYPERANDRAIWLYQNIATRRITFLKFARQNVYKKFSCGSNEDHFKTRTCMDIFRAKFDKFWICRKIFGYNKSLSCILCGDQHENE